MIGLTTVRVLKLGCSLLMTLSALTLAAGEVVVTAGLECNAVTPLNAKRAEWRQYGIINKDDSKEIWVSCPLDRIDASAFSERHFSAALSVFNIETDSDSLAEISCYLREILGAKRISGTTLQASLAPGEQNLVGACDIEPTDPASAFIFVCKLPPGTGISSLMTETHLPDKRNSLLAQQLENAGIACDT